MVTTTMKYTPIWLRRSIVHDGAATPNLQDGCIARKTRWSTAGQTACQTTPSFQTTLLAFQTKALPSLGKRSVHVRCRVARLIQAQTGHARSRFTVRQKNMIQTDKVAREAGSQHCL